MSGQKFGPIVTSHQSKIVRSIVDSLGIGHLPVRAITLNFRAQEVATISIDLVVTESLDNATSAELETVHYALMQQREQVTEQVTEQAEPQED